MKSITNNIIGNEKVFWLETILFLQFKFLRLQVRTELNLFE